MKKCFETLDYNQLYCVGRDTVTCIRGDFKQDSGLFESLNFLAHQAA